MEAKLDQSLVLSCKVCIPRHQDAAVLWEKDGRRVGESQAVRGYRRGHDEFALRVQRMRTADLGNYTCILNVGGAGVDRRGVEVSLLPPPPVWQLKETGNTETSQVLRWRGESRLPIINYVLEFRLKPVSGRGEDWIPIVVPSQVKKITLV